MEKKKVNKSIVYMVSGIVVLILAIAGSAYAYYAASATANIEGYAAGAGLKLTVTPLSTSATGDLIPLDNDIETLNKATLGYGNTDGYNANKACIDKNGYSVCKTYEITLTNTGNAPLTVNGGVSLYGENTPNIDCASMTDKVTVTNNNSCKGITTLANNETINAGASNKYYIVVYINNLNEEQNDSGAFSGTITFTSTAGDKLKAKFGEDVEIVNIAEHITNLYTTNTKTTVTNNNITYNYATSVNLMNDRLGGTTELLDAGNIRYYGASPNNYIDIGDHYKEDVEVGNWVKIFEQDLFSNSQECLTFVSDSGMTEEQIQQQLGVSSTELCSTTTIHAGEPILYRIIGVFNGKVKLIRDKPIGGYSWDTSDSSVNDGYGINEWSQADLMKLINPGFTGTGGSLWYNGSSGECYTGYNNETSSCDFTSTGLYNQVKPLIADDTWYLGGWNDNEIYANEIYGYERGENVCGKNGIECNNFNDGIERTTRWTGKIGLMYPSDYGYAADFNRCTSTLYDYLECRTSNWLAGIAGSSDEWMITPSSSYGNLPWVVLDGGRVYGYNGVRSDNRVRPVFSLISNAEMEKHAGTKLDPYVLSLP